MRLGEKSLKLIDKLDKELETTNRAQVVMYSVKLADKILENIKDNGDIIFRKKDGSEERLIII